MPAGDYQSTYNSTYAHTAPYGSGDGDDFSDVDPDFEDDVDLAPPGKKFHKQAKFILFSEYT